MKVFRICLVAVIIASVIYLIADHADRHRNREIIYELQAIHQTPVVKQEEPVQTAVCETQVSEDITSAETESVMTEAAVIEETTEEPVHIEINVAAGMRTLHETNPDAVGWITINGTMIDNIICQTDDNSYYLDHDFYGGRNSAGTLFVDYRCDMDSDDNIIIYGHKMIDGSMFAGLSDYHEDVDFCNAHRMIDFSDLNDTYKYEIIAYFVCEPDIGKAGEHAGFDYYNYVRFDEYHDFETFRSNVEALSEIMIPSNMRSTDKYLILSTCCYEFSGARFVVIARRI